MGPISTIATSTVANATSSVRRNLAVGHVEAAMEKYNHIGSPATAPPHRGPQSALDDQLPDSSASNGLSMTTNRQQSPTNMDSQANIYLAGGFLEMAKAEGKNKHARLLLPTCIEMVNVFL